VVSFPQVSPPKPCITSPLPHTCCMPHPSHSSRFDHPDSLQITVKDKVHPRTGHNGPEGE
jgi:hypothetical protein